MEARGEIPDEEHVELMRSRFNAPRGPAVGMAWKNIHAHFAEQHRLDDLARTVRGI
jgi:hypothetical protein